MKKIHMPAVVVFVLSILLASGAFAEPRGMDRQNNNPNANMTVQDPTPDVTVQSEMPPPLSSDVQSEAINRNSNRHLEEYREKDQGVPTGMKSHGKHTGR